MDGKNGTARTRTSNFLHHDMTTTMTEQSIFVSSMTTRICTWLIHIILAGHKHNHMKSVSWASEQVDYFVSESERISVKVYMIRLRIQCAVLWTLAFKNHTNVFIDEQYNIA